MSTKLYNNQNYYMRNFVDYPKHPYKSIQGGFHFAKLMYRNAIYKICYINKNCNQIFFQYIKVQTKFFKHKVQNF